MGTDDPRRPPPPDPSGDLEAFPPPTIPQALDGLRDPSGTVADAEYLPPCISPDGENLPELSAVDVGVTNRITLEADLALAIKSYYKVVLVGDPGVGKSSIISGLADDNPILSHYVGTTGVDIKIPVVENDGVTTKLQIWDSASIRPIISSYCQGAHGIVIVYDVTDKDSFNNVCEWLNQSVPCASSNVKVLLIGNKNDLDDKKVVSFETAKRFADQMGIRFMETSALNSYNVEQAVLSMFSAITCRDWSSLDTDLLVQIFNSAPVDKPEARSLMVRICSAWKKAIFSTPPWPTVLDPVLFDEERFLVYDEWVPRPFEFVDPIRNVGPINIGMCLIGCEGNTYLCVDSCRDSLVLWTLLSEPGNPDLEQHEVFFKLPEISWEDIYLGSSVSINGIGRRVILAGQPDDCVLVAATFSEGGDLLESWTTVVSFPRSQERKFVSMVFYDCTAYMLDDKGVLCSVSWEGSHILFHERSVPIKKNWHDSFNHTKYGLNIISWLITLPGTTEQKPDRLVCLNYEKGRDCAYFWASHLYEVEVNGLMDFEELHNLGTSSVFLSDSRCIPLVVRNPKLIGYHESTVFCLSSTKKDGLSAYVLNQSIRFSNHLEFESDWPFSFFALPASKKHKSVSSSGKAQPSD